MSDDRVSRRALERERRARHEAERLLEEKSRELWHLNQELERRVAERTVELSRAIERATAADERKTEFLANVSHEIRTPMTAIIGYAEMLRDDDGARADPARVSEVVDVVLAHGRHLLELINDVLDVSTIEAGRVRVEIVPVDPSAAVRQLSGLLGQRARAKGIELRVQVVEPMPRSIETDPTRLRQILVNLVGNAIKFTDRGTVTIRAAMEAGTTLRIDVIDTGIGMTREALERVRGFDAFMQADTSMTRRYGGTGLGLRISRAYAELLGGSIGVESTAGVGSRFTLWINAGLPTGADARGRGTTTASMRGLPGGDAGNRSTDAGHGMSLVGRRVLLVEDGLDNQRLLGLLLRRSGAAVTVAGDGIDALEALERGTFDLIVTDMQMPRMDGYTLTRTLRARGWTGPIIALTAHAMLGEEQRCLDAGCDAYLTKPVDRPEFERTCVALCARVVDDGATRPEEGAA